MISRRAWLQSAVFAAGGAFVGRAAAAQQQRGSGIIDTSNLFAMDQAAARSVRLPPRPNAAPSMSADTRDALEHRLRCQCGCTLDVFTCRTTDFSCQVSPAMHRDIMSLVAGGYTENEIVDAFVNTYGERVLMAPPKVGFNVVGYALPVIAVAIGAIALGVMLRRWRRLSRPEAGVAHAAPVALDAAPVAPDATPDELARLEAAIRDDA